MAGIRKDQRYRNLFGKQEQPRNCWSSVRIGSVSPDNIPIQANRVFYAVPWHIKGSLCVVPINTPGAVDRDDLPLIHQEDDTPFNDFAFNPSDDHMVALASNDGNINIYKIPEGWGTIETLESGERGNPRHFNPIHQAEKRIETGSGRLTNIQFHPLAAELVVTANSTGKEVKFWDITQGECKLELPAGAHKGAVTTLSWNKDGSLLCTESKDKEIHIFDPRQQNEVGHVVSHPSPKGGRSIWINKYDWILSTGFAKDSSREASIFDPKMLGKGPLETLQMGVSSSYVMSFIDETLGVLYLAGKGDGNMRVFELLSNKPLFNEGIEYKSSQPQAGLALLPRTEVDVKECEVAKFLKLTPAGGGQVIPISFFVPRVKSQFQADIYPEQWDERPGGSAEDWLGGGNPQGKTVDMSVKFK